MSQTTRNLAGDRGLRELEREAASGDVDAHARLLLARHRMGRLPEERLRLAAHMRDPGAVLAARELLGVAPRKQNLGVWLRAVGRPRFETWGRELPWRPLVQPTCVRIALAATELSLPLWLDSDEHDAQDLRFIQTLLGLAQSWERAPSRALEQRAANLCMSKALFGLAGEVGLELASILCQPAAPSASSPHSQQIHTARSATQVAQVAALELREHGIAEAVLRDAIRVRTVNWLLGA